MASPQQLSLDVDEIKRLLGLTSRPRVQEVLMNEQLRLEKLISHMKDSTSEGSAKNASPSQIASAQLATKVIKSYGIEQDLELLLKCLDKTFTGYDMKISAKKTTNSIQKEIRTGWDQSEKFVKIYVTLKDVHGIPDSNITVEFTPSSFTLEVKSLENANHQLTLKNLLKSTVPVKSHYKVKSDSVVIFLKKEEIHTWPCLTKTEQKSKEEKTPKLNEQADPGDSLMKMMKNMYDDGDDDMKRTIAKAWTEAQDKKQGGQGLV